MHYYSHRDISTILDKELDVIQRYVDNALKVLGRDMILDIKTLDAESLIRLADNLKKTSPEAATAICSFLRLFMGLTTCKKYGKLEVLKGGKQAA